MIEAVQIGTNRYAPQGADGIYLFNTENASNLTLGQLIAAVCIRFSMTLESMSIKKSNSMSIDNEQLSTASSYMKRLATENIPDSDWAIIKAYLVNVMKIAAASLPANASTYDNRMNTVALMKPMLEKMTRDSQQDMVELQSLVNRRDVAMTTGSNLVNVLGNSSMNIAQGL